MNKHNEKSEFWYTLTSFFKRDVSFELIQVQYNILCFKFKYKLRSSKPLVGVRKLLGFQFY